MNINECGYRPYCWPRPWWWSVYPRDTPTIMSRIKLEAKYYFSLSIFQPFASHWCLHLKALVLHMCGRLDFTVDKWVSEVTRPLDEWLKFLNETPDWQALTLMFQTNHKPLSVDGKSLTRLSMSSKRKEVTAEESDRKIEDLLSKEAFTHNVI